MVSGTEGSSTSAFNGPNSSSKDFSAMMKKSVSFPTSSSVVGSATTGHSMYNGTNGEVYMNGLREDEEGSLSNHSSDSSPVRLRDISWYTRPIHREFHPMYTNGRYSSAGYLNGSASSSGPASPMSNFEFLHQHTKVQDSTPPSHSPSFNSTNINRDTSAHASASNSRHNSETVTSLNTLAQEFFPCTLGASYGLSEFHHSTALQENTKTFSPPAKGLPEPNPTPWVVKPHKQHSKSGTKSPGSKQRRRPSSAQSSSSSASKGSSVDKAYFMSSEAPVTGKLKINSIFCLRMHCETSQILWL